MTITSSIIELIQGNQEIIATGVAAGFAFAIPKVAGILKEFVKKTKNPWDDMIVEAIAKVVAEKVVEKQAEQPRNENPVTVINNPK